MRFPQKKLISSSSGSLQSLDDLDIFPDLGLYVFGKFQKKLTVTSLLHENVTRACVFLNWLKMVLILFSAFGPILEA
jgi:hypothetical protein